MAVAVFSSMCTFTGARFACVFWGILRILDCGMFSGFAGLLGWCVHEVL